MISLLNVDCFASNEQGTLAILKDISLTFRTRERVGILTKPGSGKSTLARLLSGIDPPDVGHILREGRVSWPMGAAGFLHPELTGVQNVTTIARLMGDDPLALLAFCTQLTGQTDGYKKALKNYSPYTKAALSFALSLSQKCDCYIADEAIGFGDGLVRDRSNALLFERLENAGLVFITRNAGQMKKYCSRFMVLRDGCLIEVETPEMASTVLELDAEETEQEMITS